MYSFVETSYISRITSHQLEREHCSNFIILAEKTKLFPKISSKNKSLAYLLICFCFYEEKVFLWVVALNKKIREENLGKAILYSYYTKISISDGEPNDTVFDLITNKPETTRNGFKDLILAYNKRNTTKVNNNKWKGEKFTFFLINIEINTSNSHLETRQRWILCPLQLKMDY